ncbi:N-acetylglutamate synthase [Mesocricetibacter intestinalis]|uniref:N-acetylglutamate synthase n=1 Tax=Mesocricetibacter intestinalis TaxID=1521930 RepID=A0A4R6V6B7_9PAST|nr:GNAT family N-acetyltransferase [Mesocricetibacter intestinalis]TDQ56214.1 N-acetylglutamate synthase [Mesocricetibacter intestinalis]
MSIKILPMQPQHYPQVYNLWCEIEGMDLNPTDDSPAAIATFLAANPELNYIALIKGEIVGTIMCGFDGRRATLYHVAVAAAYQKQGIASALLSRLEQILRQKGISKGRLLAFKSNEAATEFWQKSGWILQNKLNYFSKCL